MNPVLLVPVLAACATPTPQPAGPPATSAPPPLIRGRARAFGHYAAYGGPTHPGHRRTSRYASMPDGVRLALDVILPDPLPAGERIPAILSVTPYGRSYEGADPGPREVFFATHGYAVVLADERGTGASFGIWRHPWTPESIADLGELVAWIAAQSWSNGRVGARGDSYVGTIAQLAAASGRAELRAVVPRFIETDVYADIAYPGGIYLEWVITTWTRLVRALTVGETPGMASGARLVRPVDGPDGRGLRDRALAEHRRAPPFDMTGAVFRDDRAPGTGVRWDEFSVHTFRRAIERSGTAINGWASWLDGKTAEAALRRFMTFRNPQRVVIGAWSHGGRLAVSPFARPDSHTVGPDAQALEELRFFEHHLRGRPASDLDHSGIVYYTLGAERWRRSDRWPPPGFTNERWYLASERRLDRARPEGDGADGYDVDFRATTGARSRWHTELDGGPVDYGDRAAADGALLTYTSDPLGDDMEITGDPEITVWVRSTAADGALHAYLETVDARGVVRHVVEGGLRARDRKVSAPPYATSRVYHSHRRADAAPLPVGQAVELRFALYPISVCVPKGDRLRVAIAGADAGLYARVPERREVTITVERTPRRPSAIELPVRRSSACRSAP